MVDVKDSLARVPLFAKLSRRDLGRLAGYLHDLRYESGKELTRTGEEGNIFFVVVEGEAVVYVEGEERRRLRPGDYFGEMSLIDGDLRSATVVAGDGLRCQVLTGWNFRPFLREHPDIVWGLLEGLVRRIRQIESTEAGGAAS